MKARPSKLDAHREQLLAWLLPPPDGEGLRLVDALARLKEQHGLDSSLSRLSCWLEKQRQQAMQDRILDRITTGAQLSKDLSRQFESHPAPETDQIVKLLRVLVMQLSVQSASDPALLEIVNPLMRSILDYLKIEEKQKDRALDERRVVLLEKKAAQADEAEQVTRSELTPEEKQSRLRQIFGMA